MGLFISSAHQTVHSHSTRLINGPYGVYSRDSSHNYYEKLSTHDNYESGKKAYFCAIKQPPIV